MTGMEIHPLDFPNLGFSLVLLAWVLTDMLRHRRLITRFTWLEIDSSVGSRNKSNSSSSSSSPSPSSILTRITPLCNFVISILYIAYGFYEFSRSSSNNGNHGHHHRGILILISYRVVLSALPWILASGVAVYSKDRVLVGKNWPLVLILWWGYATMFYLFQVFVYSINSLTSINLDVDQFLDAKFVDFLACPFSVLLCFSAVITGPRKQYRQINELQHPLICEDFSSNNCDSNGGGYNGAGFMSKLTFSWLNPLFKIGNSRKLELPHIPPIAPSEKAKDASSLLEESLRKQKFSDASLPKAIFYTVRRSLAINAVFAGANTLASYIGPLLIMRFVDYLSGKHHDTSYRYGLVLAVIFFVAKSVESLAQRQWYFGASRIGIRVRAAIMALVYRKSLSIKLAGRGNGKIVNLVNVDAERVGDFFCHIHGVWLLPIQVALALVILYINLGAAPCIAALSSTVLVMVCNTPLANRQERLHSKIMEARDSRIKSTSETLKSMRVLKLHSWETAFLNKLLKLRENERSWLSKYLYTCSIMVFLFWASPTLVSVATFGVCILVKTPLTSSTVLSALATFRILQEPIYNLPELISMIAQTKVSIDRIEDFIEDNEHMKLRSFHKFNASSTAVDIEVGEYSWQASDCNFRKPTLKISERIQVHKGHKVAICGSVGSGKSTLLCAILGEIQRISGMEIKVFGTKAFASQSAWIQTGTVRENILFGREMNKGFYEEVLEGCALSKDIELWADGDLCVVGERGMNLSGGQKQRIQLARAVYGDADVYFLDDPFSAVDAHTGAHIFKSCLMQLLSQKTVIYATHQLEFLDAAELVLVMKDGRIVQSGKYEDLIVDSNSELVRQMAAHSMSLDQVNTHQDQKTLSKKINADAKREVIEEYQSLINDDPSLDRSNEDEEETGRVNRHVYSAFVRTAYKGALVPIILICHVLFQGLQMGSNYWLAWATEEEGRVSRKQLLGVFVLLSGGSSIFILGRTVILSTIAIETARRLFLDMVKSVFRAPISFFDSTPSSRILNRSSTDQSIVDTDIPYRLAGLSFALIQLLSVIVLMSQVAWGVFILFIAIIGLSIWYQGYYITTARELARMNGIRKAPILHHFSETVAGVATIRCFHQEHRFFMRLLCSIDDYSRTAFHNSATMEWLSVRINFLFNLVFFIVLIILVTLPRSAIDPSLSGLAATYGLNLNVLQAWVIWNICNVENKMISVERILQFTRITSEAPLVIESSRPKPTWPSEGCIEFINLHVQYSPTLPMVLKGITSTVQGKKKVGVVGRTGSGKSTLIQALFRVVEPSLGQILIDGVDICQMGLHDLRSRLSIIPQDPMLFQGTVRANLDPLEEHSDHEIWEVLAKCRLTAIVRQDERLLDAPVSEDGENWSVGQRQLVCLARVLLQRRRILVLDEATASVDTATDNVIQQTIRDETSECTVITVAHRIPTVIDNDLVLVLDQGTILEYDCPRKLLEDSSSAFSKLVMEFLKRSSRSYH